jgi:carboxymethylenebutenolidase
MIEVVREPVQAVSFDGHRVGAFLHRPLKPPAPGLVMIPEIFGINLPLREIASRYANEGFAVLVLDIFSRMERGVDLGYDEDGHAKGRALHKAFDYATGVKDLQVGISHLRGLPECNGKVGVVGFCLGGTMPISLRRVPMQTPQSVTTARESISSPTRARPSPGR